MEEITRAEMQAMDTYAIEEIGIPSIVLMESAALKVVDHLDLKNNSSFTIICATGNNGGDGLAIARRLILADKKVDLFIIGRPQTGSHDFKINFRILLNMNVPLIIIKDNTHFALLEDALKTNDWTIDAIFGIGLNKPVKGLYAQTIQKINQLSTNTLAVDLPSGLDSDSGEIFETAVQADQTISFHRLKQGLVKNTEYSGDLVVADIGIPAFVTDLILKKYRQ